MATPRFTYVKNLNGIGGGPLIVPGKFAAGSSVAIDKGEILELTGDSGAEWVPMDSDYDCAAEVAVAACNIKSGDLAGYYPIIVPREGDVFEFTLLSTDAQNPALGTAVYWSASDTVTTTAGTNILGNVAGWGHYPFPNGFASDDASIGKGTTLQNVNGGRVQITFQKSNSYFVALATA